MIKYHRRRRRVPDPGDDVHFNQLIAPSRSIGRWGRATSEQNLIKLPKSTRWAAVCASAVQGIRPTTATPRREHVAIRVGQVLLEADRGSQ